MTTTQAVETSVTLKLPWTFAPPFLWIPRNSQVHFARVTEVFLKTYPYTEGHNNQTVSIYKLVCQSLKARTSASSFAIEVASVIQADSPSLHCLLFSYLEQHKNWRHWAINSRASRTFHRLTTAKKKFKCHEHSTAWPSDFKTLAKLTFRRWRTGGGRKRLVGKMDRLTNTYVNQIWRTVFRTEGILCTYAHCRQ